MAKVFISHARQDSEKASVMAGALSALGHQVFLDALVPGYPDAIEKAIVSSDAVLALISKNIAHDDYAAREWGFAIGYARGDQLRIIPVLLDAGASIPLDLASYPVIRADNDRDMTQVVRQVDTALATITGQRAAAKEEQEEQRERIEKNAAQYVTEAVDSQKTAEGRYRMIGTVWYVVGLLALIAGLAFVAVALLKVTLPAGDWTTFALVALRALIVIALLGACAKYAFSLGRSFTIEALKCSDRIHAISFGKFYLQAYGEQAEWKDLKEVFANWNIDRPSAFSDTSAADFDPKLVELVASVAKGLTGGKKD